MGGSGGFHSWESRSNQRPQEWLDRIEESEIELVSAIALVTGDRIANQLKE